MKIRTIAILAALSCLLCVPALAESYDGICLTGLPETGRVLLGSRCLRPGDVLTAEQAAQMVFEGDSEAVVRYLPISGGKVEAEQTLSLGRKENQPPIAEDSAVETYKNLEITGSLKVKEPEGETMTFSVVRQPKRGTVTLSENGSFLYTPKKNKIGIDSFTFTAADASGKVSREATVTVNILKPSDGARYTDTAGQDCCFAAEWMRSTGIFAGETIGGSSCFFPEKTVTQGEFLAMAARALDIPVDEELKLQGYEDVPQWMQPYLAAAIRSGLTRGMDLSPQEELDRQTAAQILANARKEAVPTFTETENAPLTRGETAILLYEANRAAGKSTTPKVVVWN